MKDFTYNDKNKVDLNLTDSKWLTDMGLYETQWILDTEWLIKYITYHKWLLTK